MHKLFGNQKPAPPIVIHLLGVLKNLENTGDPKAALKNVIAHWETVDFDPANRPVGFELLKQFVVKQIQTLDEPAQVEVISLALSVIVHLGGQEAVDTIQYLLSSSEDVYPLPPGYRETIEKAQKEVTAH